MVHRAIEKRLAGTMLEAAPEVIVVRYGNWLISICAPAGLSDWVAGLLPDIILQTTAWPGEPEFERTILVAEVLQLVENCEVIARRVLGILGPLICLEQRRESLPNHEPPLRLAPTMNHGNPLRRSQHTQVTLALLGQSREIQLVATGDNRRSLLSLHVCQQEFDLMEEGLARLEGLNALIHVALNLRDQPLVEVVGLLSVARIETGARRLELATPVTILHITHGFLDVVRIDRRCEGGVGGSVESLRGCVRSLVGCEPGRIVAVLEEDIQLRHGPAWKIWASGRVRDHLHVAVECLPCARIVARLVVHHSLQPVELGLRIRYLPMKLSQVTIWSLAC